MSQNAMRLQWTTEEVDNKLKVCLFICITLVATISCVYPSCVSTMCPFFYVLRKLGGSELHAGGLLSLW